jgi:hypothetical protein
MRDRSVFRPCRSLQRLHADILEKLGCLLLHKLVELVFRHVLIFLGVELFFELANQKVILGEDDDDGRYTQKLHSAVT